MIRPHGHIRCGMRRLSTVPNNIFSGSGIKYAISLCIVRQENTFLSHRFVNRTDKRIFLSFLAYSTCYGYENTEVGDGSRTAA